MVRWALSRACGLRVLKVALVSLPAFAAVGVLRYCQARNEAALTRVRAIPAQAFLEAFRQTAVAQAVSSGRGALTAGEIRKLLSESASVLPNARLFSDCVSVPLQSVSLGTSDVLLVVALSPGRSVGIDMAGKLVWNEQPPHRFTPMPLGSAVRAHDQGRRGSGR